MRLRGADASFTQGEKIPPAFDAKMALSGSARFICRENPKSWVERMTG